ncbi:MAG: WYL domain-containing protein [Propionivibrio sp.]|jgi:predicted DNA-binding transcriptional regulator YafY|nr:WYL domain-containing protein [Propionivibrio sp.]
MSSQIPADRFMAMLERIPRWPGEITPEIMHTKLSTLGIDVSLRTVQRNLEHLALTDPGVKRTKVGKECRYQYRANAPVRVIPSLDDHTALAFELADAFLRELMPPETIAALKPFVREAGKRLADRKRIAAAKWKDKIHVFPLGLRRKAPRIRPQVRDVVYQALLGDQVLRIAHASRGKKDPKEFVISPLGLVVRDYLIYLYGLPKEQNDKEKKQVLAFALHRTLEAEILADEPYVRPAGFLLEDYEKLCSMPLEGSPILQLKLRISESSAFSIRECPLVGRQVVRTDPDDATGKGLIVEVDVPNTVELRQWIRSLGPSVDVLEPQFLRNELVQEISLLYNRYFQ